MPYKISNLQMIQSRTVDPNPDQLKATMDAEDLQIQRSPCKLLAKLRETSLKIL